MSNNNHSNPWPGVMSYQIPRSGSPEYKFCGRNRTISSFVPLVKRYSLTTLYGRSGVGKTSFLNAGVFPILQQEGYLPVYIRLGLKKFDDGKTFAQTIVERLTEEMDTYSVVDCDWLDKSEGLTDDYLWRYFHTHRFKEVDSDGDFKTPVIILDQAEEIFNYGEKAVSLLLKQLYELMNDNLILPSGDGWFAETTCRFVISIREDYLFYLEDYIDKYDLSVLKENRFRLRPLSRSKATDVVLEPGGEYIKADEREQVADHIVRAALQEDGEVSSLMLSLVCHQLYEQLGEGEKITIQMAAAVDTSLQDYYKEAIGGLPEGERRFVENYLVRDERRRRIDYKDYADNVPDGLYLLGEDAKPDFGEQWSASKGKKFKLLNRLKEGAGDGQVEIVHDQFARVITVLKREMELEQERERRRKHMVILRQAGMAVAMLLIFVVGAIFLAKPSKTRILSEDKEHRAGVIDTIYSAFDIERAEVVLNNVLVCKNAFKRNLDIKKLVLKDNVTLDVSSFEDCRNLEQLEFAGKNISIAANTFLNCNKLKKITIRSNAGFSEFSIDHGIPLLNEIETEESNGSYETEPLGMAVLLKVVNEESQYGVLLKKCENPLYLPEEWVKKYQVEGNKCREVTVNELLTTENYDGYFYLVDEEAESLTSDDKYKKVVYAYLPNLLRVGDKQFASGVLNIIIIPNVKEIGNKSFFSCWYLKYVEAPEVETLGDQTFYGSNNKVKIDMPKLRNAGFGVFQYVELGDRLIQDSLLTVGGWSFYDHTFQYVCLPRLTYPLHFQTFAGLVTDTLVLPITWKNKMRTMSGCNNYECVSCTDDSLCVFVNNERKLVGVDLDYLADYVNSRRQLSEKVKVVYVRDSSQSNIPTISSRYLERIECSRFNSNFYLNNNTLYKRYSNGYTPILFAGNAKRLYLERYVGEVIPGDSVREIILISKNLYKYLVFSDTQRSNIIVYFPYGSKKYVEKLRNIYDYKDVREMSWLRTMLLNFSDRFRMNIRFNVGIPLGLIIIFLLCAITPLLYPKIYPHRRLRGKYYAQFLLIFLILSLVGSFLLISSPYMTDRYPHSQFMFVMLHVWFSEIIAFYIVKEDYSWKEMFRKLCAFVGAVCMMPVIIEIYRFDVDKQAMSSTAKAVVVLSGVILLVVAYFMRKKQNKQMNLESQKVKQNVISMHNRLVLEGLFACLVLVFSLCIFSLVDGGISVFVPLTLSLVFPAILVIQAVHHSRLENSCQLSYRQYMYRLQAMEEVNIDLGSGSMCKKRIKEFILSIVYCYLCCSVLFGLVLSIDKDYWILGNMIIDEDGMIAITVVFVTLLFTLRLYLRLKRMHLRYEDIIKQCKIEEKMLDEIESSKK